MLEAEHVRTEVKPTLQAVGVDVRYFNQRNGRRTVALQGIDLQVFPGEFVSIVGPSGCGKSTFINAVDGLVKITRGQLLLNGAQIQGPGPDRGMVFQSASLLPWRTVIGNVVYGLEMQGCKRKEARERAARFIALVGLSGWEDHYPYELSGGMQQRVNLARALVMDPEILLLDEPFASLDAQTREFMQQELLRIWGETRKTALFITHQINEAIYLSDRVIIFGARPGRVRSVMRIDLPRPRDLSVKRDPRFLEYEGAIWDAIVEEGNKQGLGA